MDKMIAKLADARRKAELLEQQRDKLGAELEEMPLYQSYLETVTAVADAKAEAARQAAVLKEHAVLEIFDGENKQVHPAVTIGEYTVLNYAPSDAVAACIERNLPTLLNLNKSAFNKVAKTGIFPFVTIRKEPRARIASDLSEYLE